MSSGFYDTVVLVGFLVQASNHFLDALRDYQSVKALSQLTDRLLSMPRLTCTIANMSSASASATSHLNQHWRCVSRAEAAADFRQEAHHFRLVFGSTERHDGKSDPISIPKTLEKRARTSAICGILICWTASRASAHVRKARAKAELCKFNNRSRLEQGFKGSRNPKNSAS